MKNKKMGSAIYIMVSLVTIMFIFTGKVALSGYRIEGAFSSVSSPGTIILPYSQSGIDAFIKGQYEFNDTKILTLGDANGIVKVDWKRSQIRGKVTTSLSGKEDGNSLEARILGPAQISLRTLDNKEDNSLFLLLTLGDAYCAHPSMYQKDKLQYLVNPADLNEINGGIIVSSIDEKSEVFRATGIIPHIVHGNDSNPMSPTIVSADPSAMFLPGIIWTVEKSMVFHIKKDGKPQKITIEPGKYKLDENSIPKKLK